MRTDLVYDVSFEGFLTCVFVIFEEKLSDVTIQKDDTVQDSIFGTRQVVITDSKKANRVWKGLRTRLSVTGIHQLYYSFLSELPNIENTMLHYIRYAFESPISIETDYAHPAVLKLSKITKSVGREKHRMEAFVRFRLTKDDYYFATIEPDFNVLPLILKHFKMRYKDQKWIIYDVKRKYGISYDLKQTEFVQLELDFNFNHFETSSDVFKQQELEYQILWKDYFRSANIASRKNMKLHVQHVPKRYWKYLIEKK